MSAETSGRVLVVDDSRVNRSLLVRAVQEQGYEVAEAENGQAALAQLAGEGGRDIDAVLLDLEMPELDGYETLRRMKADPRLRHVPVIIISAVDDLTSVVRCIEMGATDYLPRPFDAAILRARLSASLATKHLHDLERQYTARQAELLETIERQSAELAHFLSPQVAALVSSQEGHALLEGHRRLITAVFCDLRGFTAFSETAEPEELFGVLREYQAAMGELVVEYGGTLEHFAGDGLLVFFNDPQPVADHEQQAVRMAVAMRGRFEALQQRWHKRGYDLGFGVGIAVGHATLGRIGFEGRYDYGAIGMVVIMASRLSSEAAAGQILLSQRAFAAVEDLVVGESIGEVSLKGFSRPVPVHNVVGLREEAADPRPLIHGPRGGTHVRLQDKVTLITGAGGGMGRVAAQLFAAEGARVVVAEFDAAAGEETARLVREAGGEASFIKADVSAEADAKAMVDHAVATYGRLDCLYNNAGVMPEADHSVVDTDVATWDKVMAVNVRGVFLGCKYAIPAMIAAGGGSIINIASFVAILGCSVPQDAYTASKGALLAMTRSLAVQFGPQGIRTNAICPGPVETPLLMDWLVKDEAAKRIRLARNPTGRFGKPEEIVYLAMYLASDESRWTNGASLVVDGGISVNYF